MILVHSLFWFIISKTIISFGVFLKYLHHSFIYFLPYLSNYLLIHSIYIIFQAGCDAVWYKPMPSKIDVRRNGVLTEHYLLFAIQFLEISFKQLFIFQRETNMTTFHCNVMRYLLWRSFWLLILFKCSYTLYLLFLYFVFCRSKIKFRKYGKLKRFRAESITTQ